MGAEGPHPASFVIWNVETLIGIIQGLLYNFQSRFFHFSAIFLGKVRCFKSGFLNGQPPQKGFIQKFQPDQKLWLF